MKKRKQPIHKNKKKSSVDIDLKLKNLRKEEVCLKERLSEISNIRAKLLERDQYLNRWRKLRYEVFIERKNRCECCGRTPQLHDVALHVDHIKARFKYPELELDKTNLQILCTDCHYSKRQDDETDWRSWGETQEEKLA